MFGLKFYLNLNKEEIKYDYLLTKLKEANKRSTITNWIKRENIPNPENVRILAKELGAKPEHINKVLSEEEMKRLEFEFMYKKYDWQEVTYRDDEGNLKTEILWGQTEESKCAEEEFFNENTDKKLLKEVEHFLGEICSSNAKAKARQTILQVIKSNPNNDARMELLSEILSCANEVIEKNPNVLHTMDFEVKIPTEIIECMNTKNKVTNGFNTLQDGSFVTYDKDGVKTTYKD